MRHAENEFSVFLHQSADLPHQSRKILNIIKSQGACYEIKALVKRFYIFHGHPPIDDIVCTVVFFGVLQHLPGEIDPKHRSSAHLRVFLCMLAHAAADIQNRSAPKIRKHSEQDRGFDAVVEIHIIIPGAHEILKKSIVVVDILL